MNSRTRGYFLLVLLFFCGLNFLCTAGNVITCREECSPVHTAPVCSSRDGSYKEFDNLCELSKYNCENGLTGEDAFISVDKDFCHTELVRNLHMAYEDVALSSLSHCPLVFHPRCVSNGIYRATATNECDLAVFNRQLDEDKKFKVLMPGECPEPAKDKTSAELEAERVFKEIAAHFEKKYLEGTNVNYN